MTVAVVPGAVVVTVVPGAVTVVPEAVTVVFEPETVLVLVLVALGLTSKSPPKPKPIPTMPAAARAPLHFNTFLLETFCFAKDSSFGSTISINQSTKS